MSGKDEAEDWNKISKCGITHILSLCQDVEETFADKGIKYLQI